MSEQTALQKSEHVDLEKRAGEPIQPSPRMPASQPRRWRPRLVKAGFASVFLAAAVAPWEASTGSDCTLLLPPGRESAARANVDATLGEVFVQPGDVVSQGARIARLNDPQIEDRLTELNAAIARLDTNSTRLEEELRVRSELILSSSLKENERERLASELKNEVAQASVLGDRSTDSANKPTLPASLAVLQSEIDLKEVELNHNRREVERYRTLFEQGLIGSQQYDAAVNAMKMSEKELERARARMEATVIEHRRLANSVEASALIAQTESRAARSNFEALIAEMHANRQELESLKQRREIVKREYESMNVVAPAGGVVLGDDLRKMIGRRFSRGEEIFRIGDPATFLMKVEVSEREIAEVRLDSAVRFKLKTLPGRTFSGRVSKINAEPAVNQYGQRFYPVEVLVQNSEGMLRPGMSGFARISFGRQAIGLIVAEKVWRALRPEMWLF